VAYQAYPRIHVLDGVGRAAGSQAMHKMHCRGVDWKCIQVVSVCLLPVLVSSLHFCLSVCLSLRRLLNGEWEQFAQALMSGCLAAGQPEKCATVLHQMRAVSA
jgi:pentatricopeptide repeat protein